MTSKVRTSKNSSQKTFEKILIVLLPNSFVKWLNAENIGIGSLDAEITSFYCIIHIEIDYVFTILKYTPKNRLALHVAHSLLLHER